MPLTLSRRKFEAIIVNGAVIRVLQIRSNRVKLSIDAPLDVRVLREEQLEPRPVAVVKEAG